MAQTLTALTVKDGNGTNRTVPVHLNADGTYTLAHSRDCADLATYMSTFRVLVANMAASLTDLVGIRGSATKVVRVKKIRLEAGATTGLVANISLRKHTIANTGGTLVATEEVSFDSNNAAATAVALVYSVNPTIDASAVIMAGRGLAFTALTTQPGVVEFDFINDFEAAGVLRGVAQELVISFEGTTPGANSVLNGYIVWSEESEA